MKREVFFFRTWLVAGFLMAGGSLFAQVGIHYDQVRDRLVFGGADFVSTSGVNREKQIMVSGLGGAYAVELYHGDGLISQLKLSPDANYISFLEYVDTDDADPLIATERLRYVANDGTSSTVYRYRQFALHILSFDGTEVSVHQRVQRYAWSPDSTQVACVIGDLREDKAGFVSDGVYIYNAQGPVVYQSAAIFDNALDLAWSNHDDNIYIRTDGRKNELGNQQDAAVVMFDTLNKKLVPTDYLGIHFSPQGTYYYVPSQHGSSFHLYRTADNVDITANNLFLVELGDFLQPSFWRNDTKLLIPSPKAPHSVFYHVSVMNPRGDLVQGLVIPGQGTSLLSTNGNTAVTAELIPYYAATILTDTIPDHLSPGEQTTVQVTVRNDGVYPWTADTDFKLGAWGGNDVFAANRQLLPAGVSVAQGESYTFAFTMTAPVQQGEYTTKWRMLREAVTWFGPTLTKQIVVK